MEGWEEGWVEGWVEGWDGEACWGLGRIGAGDETGDGDVRMGCIF